MFMLAADAIRFAYAETAILRYQRSRANRLYRLVQRTRRRSGGETGENCGKWGGGGGKTETANHCGSPWGIGVCGSGIQGNKTISVMGASALAVLTEQRSEIIAHTSLSVVQESATLNKRLVLTHPACCAIRLHIGV
jgi:hypothetical protein